MTFIDLAYRISGEWIPADHGYAVYSALCAIVPELHGAVRREAELVAALGPEPLWKIASVHTIRGSLIGNRRLQLTPSSRLTLRLPVDRIGEVLAIAGSELAIGGQKVTVGPPEIVRLRPATTLYSRLVTVKGHTEHLGFLAAVEKELLRLAIRGKASIPCRIANNAVEGAAPNEERAPFLRRTVQIRDKQIAGFAVTVSELAGEESIRLQEIGIGGRRRFGCGVFIPALL